MIMTASMDQLAAFQVPLGQHLYSEMMHRSQIFWRWLGDLESETLRDQLHETPIDRPIYIAGLARSGSTKLLEIIASHAKVTTHRYRDFWTLFTPVWSERSQRAFRPRAEQPQERSHGDGILVTPDSPEAIEEILWMAFFPGLHDPARSNVLDSSTVAPKFERFYRDHLRKLLLARQGTRYASKANYHVSRLEYLIKLFPDAKFVMPVRHPRTHIASLMKQHQLFLAAAERHPRSVSYLDRVGHFEFGKHRRPICTGDLARVESIQQLWQSGDHVRGWARYWALVHGYLHHQLVSNGQLRDTIRIVRYEDLCHDSVTTLAQLCAHCELDDGPALAARFAAEIRPPSYYAPEFSREQENAIAEETASVAAEFGYEVFRELGESDRCLSSLAAAPIA
jgi:hypothetical protein